MHSIYLCTRFQSNHCELHLKIVQRIFRYVACTTIHSLIYKKNQDFKLVEYYDANYVRDIMERKSTSGGCHYLGSSLISWATNELNSITLSIAEVGYVSAASCCS